MKTLIASLDISIASPAMTAIEPGDPDSLIVNFGTDRVCDAVKGGWVAPLEIRRLRNSTERSRQFRINFLKECICRRIEELSPSVVAIEDYGGARTGSAIYLPEITGHIKNWLFLHDIPYRLYTPQDLKIYAAGRGDARKEEMIAAAIEKFGLASADQYGKSTGDVADALACLYLLAAELRARCDPTIVPLLPESTRKVFNRVTKANPDNLLVRPFVQRKAEQ